MTCQCKNRKHVKASECKMFQKAQQLLNEWSDSGKAYNECAFSQVKDDEDFLKFLYYDQPLFVESSSTSELNSTTRKDQSSPLVQLIDHHLELTFEFLFPYLDWYNETARVIQTCHAVNEVSQEIWKSTCLIEYPYMFNNNMPDLRNFDMYKANCPYSINHDEIDEETIVSAVKFSVEKLWGYRFGEFMQKSVLRNGAVLKNGQIFNEQALIKNIRDWGAQFHLLSLRDRLLNSLHAGAFIESEAWKFFSIDAPEMVGKGCWTKAEFFKAIDMVEEDLYDDDVPDQRKEVYYSRWVECDWDRDIWGRKGDYNVEVLVDVKVAMSKYLHDLRLIRIHNGSIWGDCDLYLLVGVATSGHFVGCIASDTRPHDIF